MNTLVIIPARGGSKGIPFKNIKELGGRPLICHTISIAREFTDDEHICVTSDDKDIIRTVEEYGLKVPFKRPPELSSDKAGMYDVLLHAIKYYENEGKNYRSIMLLQPTSPFRRITDLKEAFKLLQPGIDLVVSVGESPYNPYFSLYEENDVGYLKKSKPGSFNTRQESPKTYYLNGSIYISTVEKLKSMPFHRMGKIKKYVMDEICSMDIDTLLDWHLCEIILEKGYFKYEQNQGYFKA